MDNKFWVFQIFYDYFGDTLCSRCDFFVTGLCVAPYTDKSRNVKILNLLFCITYLLIYIFLPDVGERGESYFFFGLIHSDFLSKIAIAVSGIAFLGHIILFVLQIIQAVKIRKNSVDSNEI